MPKKKIQELKSREDKHRLTPEEIEVCRKFLEGLDALHKNSEVILQNMRSGKLH